MPVRVRSISLHQVDLRTRMPFKYGIATVTEMPHLFVRAEVEVDGRLQPGVAAEHLPPKWFTKDPAASPEQDIAAMRQVISAACRIATDVANQSSVFDLWRRVYDAQEAWARGTKHPPLLWGFGVSLVERAVIDAFCRAKGLTFSQALLSNAFGMRLGRLHDALGDAEPSDFLPSKPLESIVVRHTVGLSDPLTDAEIPASDRLDDGLPQALAACVRAYGLTHFKIKLAGDAGRDAARLREIARVLKDVRNVRFTLDGNENYRSVEPLRELWLQLRDEPFMRRMLVLEQPLHRDVALSDDTMTHLRAWSDRPAMIIDESDDRIDSARRALAAGYQGTSYKSCKGVFKGIANACLMARHHGIMTAEDLSTIGPIALLQDLAVVASLGIQHAERNGHHYFRGLFSFAADVQRRVLEAHSDLYQDCGFATVRIARGSINVPSVVGAPFGVGFEFDPRNFSEIKQ